MSRPWLTPAQARELAAEAERLTERVDVARADREIDRDKHRRRGGYRLEEVAGDLRRSARALHTTADDLARHASRMKGACPIDSGACPEHGGTLTESGGEAWCTAPGCGRRWGYRRMTMPCTEPLAFRVTFASGTSGQLCAGHALEAQTRGGATVVALGEAAGE